MGKVGPKCNVEYSEIGTQNFKKGNPKVGNVKKCTSISIFINFIRIMTNFYHICLYLINFSHFIIANINLSKIIYFSTN